MSDEDYTNLDLETAEQLVFAAGKPELAKALHHHAHGVRNLVQGEWGKSFVNSLEDLLVKHIDPLTKAQKETQDGVAALSGQFQSLAESVDGLQEQMHESQADRQSLHRELAAVKLDVESMKTEIAADIQTRIGRLEASLTRFESIEASLAQLVARIGDALPTEADQDLSAQLRAERGDGG